MTEKRKREVSLDCESCKRLKTNEEEEKEEEVKTVVSILDILLEEKILIPILAVLKSKNELINFLTVIGFKAEEIPNSCKKTVTSLNDISEILHNKPAIGIIKQHILHKNEEILELFSFLKQKILLSEKKIEIENEDKEKIKVINDILLEMFSKFKNGENFGDYNELIELYNLLIMKYPYTVFKNEIEYTISKESDSFVNIMNSLKCFDNNKFLEFQIHNKVFQFPQNRIYIRDCYITYYSKIWNYIFSSQCNAKVIILGQPGIGKTSFIYYLLFMLKKDLSNYYFDETELQQKSKMVEELNKLLIQKNEMDKNKNYKKDRVELIKLIEEKINILSEKTKKEKHLPRIDNYTKYNDLDKIINKWKEYTYNNEIPFVDYEPMTRFYNNMNRIYCSIDDKEEFKSLKAEFQKYMNKAVYFYTKIHRRVKELEDIKKLNEKDNKELNEKDKKELNEKDKKELNELNKCKQELNKNKADVEEEMMKFNNAVHEYDDYIKWKRDLDILNEQKNKIINDLNIPVKEEEEEEEVLQNSIDDITKTIGYNYSSCVDKVNKIVGNKEIFVVKSVNGNNTIRIYKLTKDKLVLLKNIKPEKINDSIVITDTFGYIDESNIIISISSPDDKNFREYEEMEFHKTMYLDSFSDEEMKEWYKICIDNHKPTDFRNVCEMYGNVTRQVCFHYLYEINYHKDYWEYYKQLINSVIGTIGYDDFISTYIPENNLKDNPLSNIIMKYDLEYNKDGELEPKKSLVFVSPKIGMYVSSMLFPPKNNDDYIKILKYYNTIKNDSSIHDNSIDRMLLKQIAGYKIALGEMKIKDISEYYGEVKRNSSSFSYFPFNAIEEVTYILDENDIFDFILNGVFVKILHNDRIDDDYGDDKKLKEIKEKYIKSNDDDNLIYYTVINEDEVIESINDNIVGKIRTKVLCQTPHNPSDNPPNISPNCIETYYDEKNNQLLFRNCYKQMIKIIEENLTNNENQKNYLIFGNERIGKTALAKKLNDYFIKNPGRNFNILLIKMINYDHSSSYYYSEIGKEVLETAEKITPTPPYIVISDEVVIGEDEYSDAKMIIVIGNSSDEKIKTYQSKRCPLIMYIPPFTEEEINSLRIRDDKKNKVRNYGGIVGYYNKTEESIIENIIKEMKDENKKRIVKEMIYEQPKSSLSKGYPSKICIYNTFENDVTKSTRLRFLSDDVKEIAKHNYFDFKNMNKSLEMLNSYEERPHGDLAGKIFERLILYLCEKSEKFLKLLLQYCGFAEGVRIEYVQIKSKEHLEAEIGKIKDYLKKKIIPLFDLSYNSCFSDVNFILCFIGVQITVGSTHSLSAEIIDMLDGWKKAIKTKIETEYKNQGIALPKYLNDLFNNDLKFMVISNNVNVDLYHRKVDDKNKFPPSLLKYINNSKTEDINKKTVQQINIEKEMMYLSINEIINMVNEAKLKNKTFHHLF